MSKRKKKKVLYIAVGLDKYEYPFIVCDTIEELALWADRSITSIRYFIKYHFIDSKNKCFYIKLYVTNL